MLDYVGDSRGGATAGRKVSTQCGIIGKSFRQRVPLIGSRINDNYDAYLDELVTEWNYTRNDATSINQATMSWMAIPIWDSTQSEVEGILYCDSTMKNFFDRQTRRKMAELACRGIARFLRDRYI